MYRPADAEAVVSDRLLSCPFPPVRQISKLNPCLVNR